ncbi:MAG: Rne/Rng family ribonuclease [Firmicutes bacterium]|nr:Rne/Rng family ribonuclease [Bacillota bacterium]
MEKEFLINVTPSETRMAVLEDGKLVELSIESSSAQRQIGNIYRGKVENVLPGMQAAFIDIGMEKNAFLFIDDLLPERGENGSASISDLLREGQEIIVQLVKEPMGNKGARVVTNLTIPGRYLVLMPTVDYIGISRRIEDEKERERLKKIAAHLKPKGMGLIIRTAAEGLQEEDLESDRDFLINLWQKILKKTKKGPTPALLFHDHDLLYRILRDLFTKEVDRLIIDDLSTYEKALDILSGLGPHLREKVKLFTGTSLFSVYGVEHQIEQALQRKIWLETGAYLVFDQTEALTVVDVNTGKFTGSTCLEDTVFHTNLAAAKEIARQIRLRNIGGIIIIDFIDMCDEGSRKQVLDCLAVELQKDKVKTNILGFTSLGLLEMTRKKTRPSLREQLQQTCSCCEGTGYKYSLETQTARAERRIMELGADYPKAEALLVGVNPAIAALLIGPGGARLGSLEKMTKKTIFIRGKDEIPLAEARIIAAGNKDHIQESALPVKEGEELELEVLEPHLNNPADGIARLDGYIIDIENAGGLVGQRVKVKIEKLFKTYAKAVICH